MLALVTGGAGFIGSSVADALLERGDQVRILDDLSTGYRENIPAGAEFLQGDITDVGLLDRACRGVTVVFHQAALRSVFRSVAHPLDTDTANTHGTLAVLDAAHRSGVKRVVAASSGSVYGEAAERPTPESHPALPRSPYAVSKLAGEQYCRVYTEVYGLETVALRYFNVYGPRQRADSAYPTVIPSFISALRSGFNPVVHGDGNQSRDFTFITDVVAANLAAATAPAARCSGHVYNIAGGAEHKLAELLDILAGILEVPNTARYLAARAGDVRHSHADTRAAARDLDHHPRVSLAEGLARTVACS